MFPFTCIIDFIELHLTDYSIAECSIKRYIFAKIKALKIFVPELTCC